ncbi:hypothetical protein UCDDS831_g04377 [Diplodia seriata]|uniref:Uncharacterized protein n=1 Tax=Diplodia seriata TaxID=420778 RepID=A0A0G2GWN7_9PEZI|nr:hypothetical protein UCDDS831_g04377 [Diplodia seriata]
MYSLIRDNNAQPKSMDKDKPRLFCGENGLESLDEGEKMRESDKKAAGKYGAWEGKTMAKTLQKHRALSDTLLHEMFHLFEDIEDLRTVKFAHKSSDEPEWKDEDQKIPKRDEDPVYGYLQSYQLAKYVPADALGTPETFVWFAISVFNEDWKFEGKDGVAKKMEWKK